MTNETTTDDAMDAASAALMLHMTTKKLYSLIQSGELPALKLGCRYLLSKSRILDMLREGNVAASEADGAEHVGAPR